MPRFIEWMPMSDGALFAPGSFSAAAEIRARIEAAFGPLVDDDGARPPRRRPRALPARRRRAVRGAARRHHLRRHRAVLRHLQPRPPVRHRQLHTCLALDDDIDLRTPLRAGASDEELARKRARAP